MARDGRFLIGIVGLIFLSIGLLFVAQDFGRWVARHWEETSPSTPPEVAQVIAFAGTAQLHSPQKPAQLLQAPPQPVNNYERLLLGDSSSLKFETSAGFVIELSGPAEVLFELWDAQLAESPLYLHVVSGDYQVKKMGLKGRLYVIEGGKLTIPQANLSETSAILVVSSRSSTPNYYLPLDDAKDPGEGSPPPTKPVGESPDTTPQQIKKPGLSLPPRGKSLLTLTNELIEESISDQRSHFINCQMNALRENKEAKGKMLLEITILPKGAMGEVKVIQSDMTNENLKSCVSSVFQRCAFPAFSGGPIVRHYPLVFE